jgi:hypothetical protein
MAALCVADDERVVHDCGFRDTAIEPSLWGGFGTHLDLAPEAQLIPMSNSVPVATASLYNAMANGVDWATGGVIHRELHLRGVRGEATESTVEAIPVLEVGDFPFNVMASDAFALDDLALPIEAAAGRHPDRRPTHVRVEPDLVT